jgi:signal transduction histidine kinase
MMSPDPYRILIIDDNPAIHEDFRKIFASPRQNDGLNQAKQALFEDARGTNLRLSFTIDSALQGQEGLAKVVQAAQQNDPYALAFVDIRMPPGWDGIETITHIRQIEQQMQIVIATAYSDYSWDKIIEQTGLSDNLVILKKPFETVEVLQLAHALATKWRLAREVRDRLRNLDHLVNLRTQKLEETNARLMQEIAERGKLEHQLLHAQKMEAVGQLAAGVAHDFNNLLTVIQGHAHLRLSAPDVDKAAKVSLHQIQSAAERGARLTRQLLTFSRKQVIQQTTLSLNSTLEKMTDMLRPLIGEDLRLRLALASDLPCVHADPGGIEQVIANLALNARDALSENGELSIETFVVEISPEQVKQNPEAAPGQFVCLRISDNGCGIDPSIKGRIFEPFSTTKGPGHGTGMGLAIVYGIVRQHGGWIEVASELGRGTQFNIFLPAATARQIVSRDDAGQSKIRNGHQTILVAEDEPALRELVELVLGSYGYRPLLAQDGSEALDLWRSHRESIDLLFTDIVMPGGISGWQLAAELRSQRPDLRVLFTSGYNRELEGGADKLPPRSAFLAKPYVPAQLLEVLQRSLTHTQN